MALLTSAHIQVRLSRELTEQPLERKEIIMREYYYMDKDTGEVFLEDEMTDILQTLCSAGEPWWWVFEKFERKER